MSDHGSYPVGALVADREAADKAIAGLARLGVRRHEIFVGMRNERELHALAEHSEAAVLDHAAQASGMLSGLGQLMGTEKAKTPDALIDELVQAGLPEDRARYFDSELHGERVLLVIPASAPTTDALTLLARERADLGLLNAGGKDAVIELREERVDLVKSVVTQGEVVFRTEVISEVQTFDVTVAREEFVIERRPLRPDGTSGGEIETTRIPLKHEEVAITKRTIVTDEVAVRTDQFVDTHSVSETLRHEVLEIEHSGGGIVHDTASVS